MRIDAYTHFFPKKFFDKLVEVAADYKDMGKRVRRCRRFSTSTSARRSSTATRTISKSCPTRSRRSRASPRRRQQIDEFCRLINDGFAELCAKDTRPFPGLGRAGRRSARPTPASREAERAIKNSARLACRSTPMSPASRSTARNTGRSGKR